jgi:uncharacterized protein YfdQ (DUF2303 family)
MTDADNAAQVIKDLAMFHAGADELEPGKIYAYMTTDGPKTVNLQGDEYREFPRHKQATVIVADVASFAQYHLKHADGWSEVFADVKRTSVTAVLDAHMDEAGGARWQKHCLVLQLEVTPEWSTWAGHDRQMMSQAAFAEFIEDHIADIAPDGPCTGADLLEMAQQFAAHTKVEFRSGSRLADGQTQFVYTETTEASGGQRGTVTIPGAFELGIRVFDDLDPYRVKARFRYRVTDGKLTLGYHLDDPERKVRDAVTQVVQAAETACGVKIMLGRP